MPHERLTFDPSAAQDANLGRPRLLGLGNLVRKDLAEWLHGKRPWVVLGVTTFVFALAAANARITEWAARSFPAEPGDGPAKVLSVQPLDNLVFAIGTQFIVLAAIFATMSLLLAERDSGTLAWTISKPVSRTSVLVSKWLTSTLILWVAAVVIPWFTTALVTALYGVPDLAVVIALGVTLITVPAFFVAVALAAATFVPSQAAVGAIGRRGLRGAADRRWRRPGPHTLLPGLDLRLGRGNLDRRPGLPRDARCLARGDGDPVRCGSTATERDGHVARDAGERSSWQSRTDEPAGAISLPRT